MKLTAVFFCLLSVGLGEEEERVEKSLLNTFPFNTQEIPESIHQENEELSHLRQSEPAGGLLVPSVPLRLSTVPVQSFANRQGYGPVDQVLSAQPQLQNEIGLGSVVAQKPNSDGKRCVDKVEMIEETVYDEIVKCDHSYDRRCHTSYTTTYEAQQEEDCDDNYIKRCYIAYENIAFNETVRVCRTPLVKDCESQGEPVCRTVYESECWTKQEENSVRDDVVQCQTVQDEKCEDQTVGYTTETKCQKWPRQECKVVQQDVKKYTPVTGCTKEPRQLCAPAGCGFKEAPEVCQDKVKTIVQEKPTEECDIEPHRQCKHVTRLVPRLEPREECVDVPKEVCTRARANPRKVKKPVIKKWCYVPSPESGLA